MKYEHIFIAKDQSFGQALLEPIFQPIIQSSLKLKTLE
jgi:hypothetical protein